MRAVGSEPAASPLAMSVRRVAARSAVFDMCNYRMPSTIYMCVYVEHLAPKGTPKAKAILVKADQVVDALELDDEMVDGLLFKLRLE